MNEGNGAAESNLQTRSSAFECIGISYKYSFAIMCFSIRHLGDLYQLFVKYDG